MWMLYTFRWTKGEGTESATETSNVKRPAVAGDLLVTGWSGKPYLVQGGMEEKETASFISLFLPAARSCWQQQD